MSTHSLRPDNRASRAAAVRRGVELHEAGMGWYEAADAVGITYEQLRCDADPEFAARRRARVNEYRKHRYRGYSYAPTGKHTVERTVTPEEALAAIASIPHDTRSLTSRAFGDPLPGRSALDRRTQGSPKVFHTINTIHTDRNEAGVDMRVVLEPLGKSAQART